MIITCPACASQFRLPDDALGATGRKLRCSACRHIWFAPAPVQPETTPQPAPDTESDAPEDASPEPAAQNGAASGIAPDHPAPDESTDDAAIEARQDDPPAPTASPPTVGAAPTDWEPGVIVPRRAGRVAHAEAASDEEAARPRRRRGGARLLLLVLLAAIVAAAWLGRDEVLRRLPRTAPLYQAVGLLEDPSSHGLRLEDVAWRIEGEGDDTVLVVAGRVRNAESGYRLLPELAVQLLDDRQIATHTWHIAAPATGLSPGSATPFEARFADPPRTGGDDWVWVTFADQL